ncbi:MAG: NAD(P)/FAD-dependent oxidoreductase [Bacteroidia bacterium]|jgi:hypothetical protein|nr:NAD(P)/FAD-dependent oxidoreductase [Bacteroidia bacterium]
MRKQIELALFPEECYDEDITLISFRKKSGIKEISAIHILRKSLDARKKPICYRILAEVFIGEPKPDNELTFDFKPAHHQKPVAIIGAGPAGLFAALKCLELGLKPIIFERGKNVRERRRDLAQITRFNSVNPESNYCFGEGGAGTYSDGKLYTRSTKRGDVQRILKLLVHHGAEPNILYEAHPHIGTNKLPHIITKIRETIEYFGGEVRFNSKLTNINFSNNAITSIQINGHEQYPFNEVILATGHSARDIFELLHHNSILIEAKPFALGVRIEHPQELIDSIQYKCKTRNHYLPPAAYSVVNQSLGHGVFSFCMCPGGIIAPAATAPGEIVVNGWSPSKRNNAFANSGLVVSINPEDWKLFADSGHLAALRFQQQVEQACFNSTNSLQAPAQRIGDFVAKKHSTTLPECSYLPGIQSHALDQLLPAFVANSLRHALQQFDKKLKGYITNEGVLVGTESRTSSPVRIPRDKITLEHIQIKGLYPCAEGAGYAGGIVSAAIDGENVVEQMAKNK